MEWLTGCGYALWRCEMQALLNRSVTGRVIAGCLLLALSQSVGATPEPGLRAVYEIVRTRTNPVTKGESGSTVERGVLTVRLTPNMVAVRENDVERIVNFGAGRVVVLDHAERSAIEHSLYAVPAFREKELVNRAMSRGFAKIFAQKYDLVDAESELGMLGSPPAKLKMSQQQRGTERVFVLNKHEAVSFVPATLQVPETLAKALDRLYLFEAQLHPRVRAVLTSGKQLPARLSYEFRLFQAETTVVWELREAVLEEQDLGAAATAYAVGPLDEAPILVAAWRVRTGQAGPSPTAKDYEERAARLLAEGRAFESFLVGMEAAFATGEIPEGALKRARDAGAADPRMQDYVRAGDLEARHGDPQEALRLLEALDADTLEGGAAIFVQRANQYVRQQQGEQALQEFGRALNKNPFMIGPWHDAGWVFSNGYAMVMAWTCWDAARTVAADAPELRDVKKLEAALSQRHPEFF
jgi:tetratricopeptide (TPR) repeat protein